MCVCVWGGITLKRVLIQEGIDREDVRQRLRVGMYRVGRVGQAVELVLHLLQDVCGGAVLRCAVVDLVQDSVENLRQTQERPAASALEEKKHDADGSAQTVCRGPIRTNSQGSTGDQDVLPQQAPPDKLLNFYSTKCFAQISKTAPTSHDTS